jgi:hypothetical protein
MKCGQPLNGLPFSRPLTSQPQITLCLEFHPITSGCAQRFGGADVHVGQYGCVVIEDTGEHGARNADLLGERRNSHVQVIKPPSETAALPLRLSASPSSPPMPASSPPGHQ